MTSIPLRTAAVLALLLPAALLGGAWIGQLGFGLYPCEMCHWQRWPHYAALAPAIGAVLIGNSRTKRLLIILAAALVAISGLIGIFHAGVEYHWWQGLTRCTAPAAGSLDDLMNAPMIRCDVAAWTLFGISLAGYNAIISLGGAGLIGWLLTRHKGTAL